MLMAPGTVSCRPARHSDVGYTDAADAPNASDLFRVSLELRSQRAWTNAFGTTSVSSLAPKPYWCAISQVRARWARSPEMPAEQIRSIRSLRNIRISLVRVARPTSFVRQVPVKVSSW